ncbi:DinB family protein [Flavobacteriaceae bacterium GF1]
MENWGEQIDKNTQGFSEIFGGLTNAQLNWKPNSKTWSVAQNIEHLIVVNKCYFPVIDSIRKGTYKTPFLAKSGFMVSFFERMVLKAVQPDRKKKMKTFPIWEPAKSEIPIGILDRFKEHQSELKKMIENSEDLVEKGTIISSPANKNIVYKLGTAFDIIVNHEKRHLEQSKEVYERMKNEASS